jgi:hypothetical protein
MFACDAGDGSISAVGLEDRELVQPATATVSTTTNGIVLRSDPGPVSVLAITLPSLPEERGESPPPAW